MEKTRIFFIVAFVLLAIFLCFFSGCTFHLKATDIEAEGTTNVTYELESLGLLQTDQANTGKDGIGRFITF